MGICKPCAIQLAVENKRIRKAREAEYISNRNNAPQAREALKEA